VKGKELEGKIREASKNLHLGYKAILGIEAANQ
jgi:hypothetical protein